MMYITTFKVKGVTAFPLDMLRYDLCCPRGQIDVEEIHAALDREPGPHEVHLIHVSQAKWVPTVDRWNSFGWGVIMDSIDSRRA